MFDERGVRTRFIAHLPRFIAHLPRFIAHLPRFGAPAFIARKGQELGSRGRAGHWDARWIGETEL